MIEFDREDCRAIPQHDKVPPRVGRIVQRAIGLAAIKVSRRLSNLPAQATYRHQGGYTVYVNPLCHAALLSIHVGPGSGTGPLLSGTLGTPLSKSITGSGAYEGARGDKSGFGVPFTMPPTPPISGSPVPDVPP